MTQERVVLERRARSTGTTVQLVDRGTYTDGMEDNAEDRWETICVDHGGVCSHATRKLARSFMAAPEEWCEDCQHGAGTLAGTNAVPSPVPTKTYHVVCRDCGTRWTTESAEQPRRCVNEECEAGWMDLPMFADKADADRAAASFTTSTWPAGILSRVSREAYDAITRSRAFDSMTPQEREDAAVSYDRLLNPEGR